MSKIRTFQGRLNAFLLDNEEITKSVFIWAIGSPEESPKEIFIDTFKCEDPFVTDAAFESLLL